MKRNEIIVLGLTVAAVVIVPGLANGFLSQLGYPWVGSAVWAMGYGLGVVFIWYEWIRPLDITGPKGVRTEEGEADRPEASDRSGERKRPAEE